MSEFGDDDRTTDGQSFYGMSSRLGVSGGLRPAALVAASLASMKGPPTSAQDRMESFGELGDVEEEKEEEEDQLPAPPGENEIGDGAGSSQGGRGNLPAGKTPANSATKCDLTANEGESAPQVAVVGPMRDHNGNEPKSGKTTRAERMDSDSGYDNTVFVDDLEAGRSEVGTNVFNSNMPQHQFKVVAETKVAQPDKSRLLLRNVLVFLVISNACLWMFWSLEGTAFIVYTYPYEYYSSSVWTTIAMICRPLSIFFRMHSAACLFEIWSFA